MKPDWNLITGFIVLALIYCVAIPAMQNQQCCVERREVSKELVKCEAWKKAHTKSRKEKVQKWPQ